MSAPTPAPPSPRSPYYLLNKSANKHTGPFSTLVDAMLAQNLTPPSTWVVVTPDELKKHFASQRQN